MTNNNELMNEEVMEVYDEEIAEEVKESKFKGFVSKAGAGIKKHGKKVAGIAALAAVGMIGYALGHKSGDNGDFDYSDDYSEDFETPEEVAVESDVTEE